MSAPERSTNPFVKGAPPRSRVVLPWVLAGVFAIIAAVLLGMLLAQQGELQRLRTGAASPSAPTTTPAPAAPPSEGDLPQPETRPEVVKLLNSLPTRVEGDPLALGKVDAPVVMIVWSDFRCPFCSKWERETLTALMPYVNSGSLRVEHRDLVMFGEDSERTAIAARAAGKQGKFWEFASAVAKAAPLSGHPDINDAAVLAFAKEAGVADLEAFKAAMSDPALKAAIDAETKQAQKIGIGGTPFFVVNHTPIRGAVPAEVFAGVIEANGGKK